VELLVTLALGSLIMAGVMELFRQGVNASSLTSERGEMQQNARVALNLMSQDLSVAGTGLPQGGIQLPSGTGSSRPTRGCFTSSCGIWQYLADDRLYSVTPGDGLGPTINGVATDVVTLVYRDTSLSLSQAPLNSITASGDEITTEAGTSAGVIRGDILMLCNANGCAAAAVTSTPTNDTIALADSDSLNFNQSLAAFGNIASIANAGPPAGVYPPTTAYRILVTTYFIEAGTLRLMRQVNAHPPVPVAEIVENLQISYDTFDDATLAATADLPDAGNVPNQIRKVNMVVGVRSPSALSHDKKFDRLSLRTSVSVRNLTFRDRYL
jgi:Tfp pilus assembly protein PilW